MANGFLAARIDDAALTMLVARAEASPGYRITVDLTARTVRDDGGVEVPYAVDDRSAQRLLEDGSALASVGTVLNDYTKITNQLITIPAGQLSAKVPVNIVGDAIDEIQETFSVKLSGHGMVAMMSHGAPLTLKVTPNDPVMTDPNSTVRGPGFIAPVGIATEDEVRLKTRDVPPQHLEMADHVFEFLPAIAGFYQRLRPVVGKAAA